MGSTSRARSTPRARSTSRAGSRAVIQAVSRATPGHGAPAHAIIPFQAAFIRLDPLVQRRLDPRNNHQSLNHHQSSIINHQSGMNDPSPLPLPVVRDRPADGDLSITCWDSDVLKTMQIACESPSGLAWTAVALDRGRLRHTSGPQGTPRDTQGTCIINDRGRLGRTGDPPGTPKGHPRDPKGHALYATRVV